MSKNIDVLLEELKNDFVALGEVVRKKVIASIEALENQDLKKADRIMKEDDEIDEREMEIKDRCRELIARSDLSDKDIRTLLVISESVSDLERIGDHAENIAVKVEKIGIQPLIKPLIDIPRMRDLASDILRNSLEAFKKEDVEMAKNLANQDEEIDNLNIQVFRELITFMMEKQSSVKQASSLMLISRYLERIGDHSTNICEGIVYMVSGERKSF